MSFMNMNINISHKISLFICYLFIRSFCAFLSALSFCDSHYVLCRHTGLCPLFIFPQSFYFVSPLVYFLIHGFFFNIKTNLLLSPDSKFFISMIVSFNSRLFIWSFFILLKIVIFFSLRSGAGPS